MYGEDDYLALSGLQHLSYCERQWALIHVEQCWVENADTVRGNLFHERVDSKGYTTVRGFRAERQVRLESAVLGIYGIADIVEYGIGNAQAVIRPVEYKVGKAKIGDWDRIQLAAEALCLEEMEGVSISEGFLFYGETHRRERVALTDDLRNQVTRLAARMHELFDRRITPPPRCSAKCRRCSLSDVCIPSIEREKASAYWMSEGVKFWSVVNEKAT